MPNSALAGGPSLALPKPHAARPRAERVTRRLAASKSASADATINTTSTDLITDLGTLGGAYSDAGMINSAQTVAGQASLSTGDKHAYIDPQGGPMRDLGTLGGTDSAAHALDSSGTVVVGDSEVVVGSSIAHPARWSSATGWQPEDLGTLAQGNGGGGVAYDVNSAGDIVGDASINGTATHAFEYSGGQMADLGTLSDSPGAPSTSSSSETSTAYGINDSGEIVGSSDGGGMFKHAFLIPPGGGLGDMQDINPSGEVASEAYAVNSSGDIAMIGWDSKYLISGYLYKYGVPISIGSVAGGNTVPQSLNDRDEVVGASAVSGAPGDGNHAFVYRNGTLTDLNNLLPLGTGWTLNGAFSITDGYPRAQVVGYGIHNAQTHAFLLNLCEEICISSVDVQTRAVPSGDWVKLNTNTTYDGNPIRLVAHVENMQNQAESVRVLFKDPNTSTTLAQQVVTVPANQTVDVNYTEDTTGQAWGPDNSPTPNHTIDTYVVSGGTTLDDRPTAIRVNPRPVFLVHGLWSNADTWKSYTGFLSSATPGWQGFPVTGMNTGTMKHLLTEVPNTIKANAQILASFIEAEREKDDIWHIDLVAHSMGGLISRYYINSLMPDSPDGAPVVRHLVMLGTPNMGSACASIIPVPDTFELQPLYVSLVFNHLVTNDKNVAFSNLVGEAIAPTCLDPSLGDEVVPFWSAEWRLSDYTIEPIFHLSMTGDYPTFLNYVLPHLTTVPSAVGGMSRDMASQAAEDAPGLAPHDVSAPPQLPAPQLAAQEGVTIPASGSVDVSVPVGAASAFGVTIAADSTVSSEIHDPSGGVSNVVSAGSPDSEDLMRSARVSSPAAGTWTVHLTNTGTSSEDVDVSSWVEGSPVSLTLASGPSDANGDVPLQATLTNAGAPVQAAQITVSLQPQSGPPVSLQLQDDGGHEDAAAGDGIYGGTASGLTMGGYYVATVKAVTPSFTRITTGGLQVSTSEPNDLVASPPAATLAPGASPMGGIGPAPARHPFRGMLIQSGRIRLRHGKVILALQCPATDTSTCRGEVTLQTVPPRRRRPRVTVLGKAAAAVNPGMTKLVTLRLGGAAIGRVSRSRSLRVNVIVVAAGGQGIEATTERTVLLLLTSRARH